VLLSELNPTPRNLVAWLCYQGTAQGRTIQLLVHGLTYDHTYWDFPYQPQTHAYVRAATAAGYATLAIDRIGAGQSDRPGNPAVLTTGAAAYVLHQIVQSLRGGAIGGVAFTKVITVGHSFGSQVVASEAAEFGDVDGVVLTGALHIPSAAALTNVIPTLYPAHLDAKFIGTGLPLGYLTTLPGTRGASFYHLPAANPGVVATDEQLKQTAAEGELATIANGALNTGNIQVPVLLAIGRHDLLFCDAIAPCTDSQTVLARESSYYTAQACLEAYVLPDAGHSINLHPNAPDWFAAAKTWADRRIGTAGGPPTQPC
jgi:pimeloyl-ACP methyl ester carboxylesterase